jgi:hypothetical protein
MVGATGIEPVTSIMSCGFAGGLPERTMPGLTPKTSNRSSNVLAGAIADERASHLIHLERAFQRSAPEALRTRQIVMSAEVQFVDRS